MDVQMDIDSEKSAYWFKVGLGLRYLKKGIFPFCDTVLRQQHAQILDDIKTRSKVSQVRCDKCSIDILFPSHKTGKSKVCPKGLTKCNCCKSTNDARACPNNVCGIIYDSIVDNYSASPKPPYWTNTNAQKWCEDPWAVAKCFINMPGYKECEADKIDASGLLSLIINNLYFHKNNIMIIDGKDPLSKVKQIRNTIFHSNSMELDKAVSDSYVDEMISVLEYVNELRSRDDAKIAVAKLRTLKQQDFVITLKHKSQILEDSVKALMNDSKILDERLTSLELKSAKKEQKQKLKDRKKACDYQISKLEFQGKLIQLYRDNTLQVNSMPFQSVDDFHDFERIYENPHIILKSNNEKIRDIEMAKMSDIFMREGKQVKSICVYGEAGSGKTSFCLSLLNFWCLAHSQEGRTENETEGITEMRKFEFVFYVSLRYCKDILTIHEMITSQFKAEIIHDLLKKESDKILIILDGLDEYTPFTKEKCDQFQMIGIPERDHLKDYTLIATSRLKRKMTKNKSEHVVEIKGIAKESFTNVIKKCLSVIESFLEKPKDATLCENDLEDVSFVDIKYIPIMLQFLICLWYDDKLLDTSNSALFTKIVDLYFDWHKRKFPESIIHENKIEIKQSMSILAYNTLLDGKIAFTLDQTTINMPEEDRKHILELGILTKEKFRCASEHPKELYSFVHKSIQEFLCALHLSGEHLNSISASYECFLNGKTVSEIVDYTNMFIFLCGLKPCAAETISTSIYNICAKDKRIIAYREENGESSEPCQIVSDIQNIQTFIFSSVIEVRKCKINLKPRFHLGDMVIDDPFLTCEFFCTSLEQEYVVPGSVLSINIDIGRDDENVCNIFKYLAKCNKLEKLSIRLTDDFPSEDEDVEDIYASFDVNAQYLKSLFLSFKPKEKYSVIAKTLIQKLPKMDHLIVINMEGIILAKEDCLTFCKLISEKANLEVLLLKMLFKCDAKQTLDLRRHRNLKRLSYDNAINVDFSDCLNLSIFKFLDIYRTNYTMVFENLKSKERLKELELGSSLIKEEDQVDELPTLLNELLKSLTQLTILKLHNFDFKTSKLLIPHEVIHIKEIHLFDIKMRTEPPHTFVDSSLANNVIVFFNSERLNVKQDERHVDSADDMINEENAPIKNSNVLANTGPDILHTQNEKMFSIQYESEI